MGIKLLICGSGSASHVLAALASNKRQVDEIRVLTLSADKANQWEALRQNHDICISTTTGATLAHGGPTIVSNDPSIASGCDIIVLSIVAFAHDKYLQAIKPYVAPQTVLVACPGAGGFFLELKHIWDELLNRCVILSFESSPWACRLTEIGKSATIRSTKVTLIGAMINKSRAPVDAVQMFQVCIGELPKLEVYGHMLGMSLSTPNATVHGAIMYGTWHDWDGSTLDKVPMFYREADEFSANVMSQMGDEIIATTQAIIKKRPDVDLTNVRHIYDYFLKCYAGLLMDTTSLHKCLTTKISCTHQPLLHPMIKTNDGRYTVNFNHRYFDEDIPYGVVVLKGVAELAGVDTPAIDKVIAWAQQVMDKEYLVNGKLSGKDVVTSRAPQAYGIATLDELLASY